MSVAQHYGRHNVIARLSSNLNTNLLGFAGISYSKNTISQLEENHKSVFHYESEHVRADKDRIKVGLKKFKNTVSNKTYHLLTPNVLK